MILHFDEEHVASLIETNFVGLIQGSRGTVAGVALGSATGNRGEAMGLHVEPADPVVSDLAEIERAIRADDETVGILGLARDGRAAIAGEARDTGSGDSGDGLRGGGEDQGQKDGGEETHRVHYIGWMSDVGCRISVFGEDRMLTHGGSVSGAGGAPAGC
jgi:hypothetical protein